MALLSLLITIIGLIVFIGFQFKKTPVDIEDVEAIIKAVRLYQHYGRLNKAKLLLASALHKHPDNKALQERTALIEDW